MYSLQIDIKSWKCANKQIKKGFFKCKQLNINIVPNIKKYAGFIKLKERTVTNRCMLR